MRKVLVLIIMVTEIIAAQAQILKPVKWSFNAVPVKGKADMYKVSMTAVMEKGWHIYAQNTPEGGPSPTKVVFAKNPLVLLGGKTSEVGKLHKELSDVFGVEVLSYGGTVSFVQVVKVKKPGVKTSLSGTVEFMACDASQCLPPEEVAFEVELK